MTNTISLDAKHSTARLLTKEKPIVESKPEEKFETVLFLPEGENRKGELFVSIAVVILLCIIGVLHFRKTEKTFADVI